MVRTAETTNTVNNVSDPPTKGWRRYLWAASLKRVGLETFLAGSVIWLCILATSMHSDNVPSRPVISQPMMIFTINPIIALYFALRLRLPQKLLNKQAWRYLVGYTCLNIFLNGIGALIIVSSSYDVTSALFSEITTNIQLILSAAAITLILNEGWYIFVRLSTYALIHWNRLRRKELRWAITHAHVMIVAFSMGLLIIVGELIAFFSSGGSWTIYELIPTLFLMLGLSAIPIIFVMPPLAFFSHFVMRKTVNRIRTLAKATSALRSGDYSVRVPVSGEDEVAQLQADFNAMADNLQRAMQDLQSERDRVARLLQERRELIANVSHELRTPVAALRGYLESSLEHWEQVSQSTLYQDMRAMESETLQLQERIEELFTLARAELGRLTLHCELIAAEQLVRRVAESNAPLAWRASKIEVLADIPESVPTVYADPQRLEQALRNLLHNALRHTAPGGFIVLALTLQADQLRFQVKDTGEGIATEDLPHIWERFYQAKNSPTRKRGGSGLGLALVKQWIETMGGSVSVQSIPGEGSCFTLSLPIAPITLRKTLPLSLETEPQKAVVSGAHNLKR